MKKKVYLSLLVLLFAFNAFAENSVFAITDDDNTLFCIQFKNGISLIFRINAEMKGYTNFDQSVLFTGDNNLLLFGITSIWSFLDSSYENKELKIIEIIKKYYEWEKEYQEKECGNIFKDELKYVNDKSGRVYGKYRYYRDVDYNTIKDTETIYNDGYCFIQKDYIIYINTPVLKSTNTDEIENLLVDSLLSLKVYDKKFDKNDLFKIYEGL